jgi:hypothetical protein
LIRGIINNLYSPSVVRANRSCAVNVSVEERIGFRRRPVSKLTLERIIIAAKLGILFAARARNHQPIPAKIAVVKLRLQYRRARRALNRLTCPKLRQHF